MKGWTRLSIGILTAMPLILYAPFLFGGKVLYWGVYLLQFHPWRQLAVEQIRAGHWPLWNPYLGAGTPLAANLQTAAFYPPNAIFLLMPVDRALGWGLALHVVMAGVFTYYLGRTLGLSPFGALASGLAYGLGGFMVARWLFPSMVYAAAWLPLMLALTERVLGARHKGLGTIGPACLLAMVIGLQLLAGHAQTSFYSLLIVAAFALMRLVQWRAENREQPLRATLLGAGTLLLAALWGLALAAIQLLPTAELAAHSQRAGKLTDLQFAYELSFWPWRLISLLAPDFFGNPARNEYWAYGTYWEEAAYVGILPLMLATLALAAWWGSRRTEKKGAQPLVPFFALLALVSLVLALGNHTPIFPLLFEYVPGFGLFQAPARLLIGYALGMALLAGIGADTLRITPRTRSVLRLVLLAGLGMGLAAILARLALPSVRPTFGNSTARLGFTLALSSAVLLLQGRRLWGSRPWRDGRWQAAVIALIAADLLLFGWGLAPGTDASVYREPVATAEFLKTQPSGRVFVAYPYARQVYDEYVSLQSFGSTDPAYLQDLRESQHPNLSAAQHLAGVGNYDPLTVGVYRDLWDQLEGARDAPPTMGEILPLLDLFGARYLISGTTTGPAPLPVIYDNGPSILRNDMAFPEAHVVSEARIVEDVEARLALLLDPSFDPHTEVLLSTPPTTVAASLPATSPASPPQPAPPVRREGPDRVVIQVEMTQAGYLVLADTYYPGWRALVDGQETEILAANHAFRAVALTAGEHTVVFEYAPLSFRLGAWISLGALLLLVTFLGISQFRRRAP
jgi:hypothetical protein